MCAIADMGPLSKDLNEMDVLERQRSCFKACPGHPTALARLCNYISQGTCSQLSAPES